MFQMGKLLKGVAAAAVLYASQASAGIFFATGDTTGDPTFNRPLADLSGLSAVGTDVAYDAFTFSVDVAGTYKFFSWTGSGSTFDNFIILYSGFSTAMPLAGAIVANDDWLSTTNASFTAALTTAGVYTLVTTGFANDDFGTFKTLITGPGNVTAPVPEPETYALMLAGLGLVGFLARRRRTQA
jgi:hypothetical protein